MEPESFSLSIATYDLEGSIDGWGILLAASIGIASIATGLCILGAYGATSVFVATVGTSLVMQGVGDLVQSLVAFVKDQPIEVSTLLKSKGMAMAVTLATAGLLHGANMIPYIQNLSFMQKMVAGILSGAADGTNMILTALAVQGASSGIGAGLNHLGKKIDLENIEADANDEVGKIIKNYKTTLNRIYATDQINGNTVLQDKLDKRIEKSAQDEQGRFHDDKTKFVKQVSVNIGTQMLHTLGASLGLNEIDTATTTAMGAIKSAQALDRFIVLMRVDIQKVGSQASSSAGMMKTLLHNEFGETQGNEIFTQIKDQGYVREGEIIYLEQHKNLSRIQYLLN